ncbi:hypothetical protein M9H77_09117 [Catharanthus roseus]|uniref:Uncharacterized protein n=1 Tax=Catharanthus roseus TaxID=4058 RepID=A0ACC0BZV8_CATRO|nr:hypothetical protein M9H77_09117 [Catharanthus roseus]
MDEDVLDYSLHKLESYLKDEAELGALLRDQIGAIKMRQTFLQTILDCSEKWRSEDGYFELLLARARMRLEDAIRYLFHWTSKRLSFVVKNLNLIKHEMRKLYHMAIFIVPTKYEPDHVLKVVDSLLRNIVALLNTEAAADSNIGPVRNELVAVREGLDFLESLLGFTAKRGGEELERLKDLLSHAKASAFKIRCLIYLCSAENMMDGQKRQEMKLQLEEVLQMIHPLQPLARDIYAKALKELSESPQKQYYPTMDKLAVGFLHFLLHNMIDLSEGQLRYIVSVKDHILALHELVDYYRKLSRNSVLFVCIPTL